MQAVSHYLIFQWCPVLVRFCIFLLIYALHVSVSMPVSLHPACCESKMNYGKIDWLREFYATLLNARTKTIYCECCSLIGRHWCGVLLGLEKYRLSLKRSWLTTFRSISAPRSWRLITTSCRLLMFAMRRRKKPSKLYLFLFVNCVISSKLCQIQFLLLAVTDDFHALLISVFILTCSTLDKYVLDCKVLWNHV